MVSAVLHHHTPCLHAHFASGLSFFPRVFHSSIEEGVIACKRHMRSGVTSVRHEGNRVRFEFLAQCQMPEYIGEWFVLRICQTAIPLVLALCCLSCLPAGAVTSSVLVGSYTLHGAVSPTGTSKGFSFSVVMDLTGFNQSASFYNTSISETLAAVRVEYVWSTRQLLWREQVGAIFATSNATAEPSPYSRVTWHAENTSFEASFEIDDMPNNGLHMFMAVAEFVVVCWVDSRATVFFEDVSYGFGVSVATPPYLSPEVWFVAGLAVLVVGFCYLEILMRSVKGRERTRLSYPAKDFD